MKNFLDSNFSLVVLRHKQRFHEIKKEKGLVDLIDVIINNIKKKAATTDTP